MIPIQWLPSWHRSSRRVFSYHRSVSFEAAVWFYRYDLLHRQRKVIKPEYFSAASLDRLAREGGFTFFPGKVEPEKVERFSFKLEGIDRSDSTFTNCYLPYHLGPTLSAEMNAERYDDFYSERKLWRNISVALMSRVAKELGGEVDTVEA